VISARPVAASADVGSPELAAALAASDPVAVGRALQSGWVIVAVTRHDDRTDIRLFDGLDPERPGWELPLFSTTAALRDFLADDPAREFDFVRAASLAGFLESARETIARVVFDPASPHAVAASVDDILDAISDPADEPRPSARGIADTDRALDLELPLGEDWFRIDLTDTAGREERIGELIDRQLAGLDAGPVLRTQLSQWLRRMIRVADGGRGRETAFLTRRSDTAALALSMTRYWQPLGPALGGRDHLDALADRLRAQPGEDELVMAQTPTGRLLRRTHESEGSAELRAQSIPVLTIDYWLEFPDRRGLCLVSFSTPHSTLREAISELTDEIVVASSWVIAGTDPETR